MKDGIPTREELQEEVEELRRRIRLMKLRRSAGDENTSDDALTRSWIKDLFDNSRDAIVITDVKGLVRDFNQAAEVLFGLGGEDLDGRDFGVFFLDPNEKREFLRELETKGRVVDFPARLRRDRDDSGRDCLMSVALIRGDDRRALGFQGVIRDVTVEKQAGEKLRETEKRFRLLSENAPDIIYTLDEKGAFTYVSAAWRKLLGHEPEDVLGRKITSFTPPGEADECLRLLREARDGGKTVADLDMTIIGQDGESRSFSLSCSPSFDDEGRMTGMVGVLKDISARFEAQAEIRRQRAFTEQLIESAPEAIVVLDMEDRILRFNSEFGRLFGYSIEEAVGRPINQLIVPAAGREEGQALTDRASAGERVEAETRRRRKDGSLVHVSVMGAPMFVDGSQVGILGIYRDISKRKAAEAALQEQEEKYSSILEDIEDGYYELDLAGNFTFATETTADIVGVPRMEFIGRNFSEFCDEQNARKLKEAYSRVFQTGRPNKQVSYEISRGPDRLKKIVEASASLIRDDEGRPAGFRGIIRDMTARRQAEEALKESEKRFREMADLLPTVIAEADLDLKIIYSNKIGLKTFGLEESDLAEGVRLSDLVHPDMLAKSAPRMTAVLAGQTLGPTEYRLITRDRGEFTGLVTSSPIYKNNEIVGLRTTVQDISQIKRAEKELNIQKAYLDGLIDNAPEAIVIMDRNERIIRINAEFTRLFGYTPEEALGWSVDDLILSQDLNGEGRNITEMVTSGQMVSTETLRKRKNGDLVQVSLLAAAIQGDEGPLGHYGIYRDISERKKAEEALRDSEERHRTVLEAAPDPVMVVDMEGRITYLNPAFTRVFGWTLAETRGSRLDFTPEEGRAETRLIENKIKRGWNFSGVETKRATKSGHLVDVSISGAVFFDRRGTVRGGVMTLQDITERKKAEQEITHIAYHDSLTGLPNRKSFYLRLDEMISQANRRKVEQPWALMFLDLDRFKNINDTLGHDVGDELLITVASRIKEGLRKSDLIFRLGGDEFTIILSNLSQGLDVAKVAEKIRRSIFEPMIIKGHELQINASIGISVYPTDGLDVEVLVKNADMAMYAAKEEKTGYRFFTEEMNLKAIERMRLESSLRNALEKNEFIVYYQPLVDFENRVVGMEALLRWEHPELGLVSPAQFIPLAEENGSIVPIGEWVLGEACRQAKAWQDQGYKDLYVAVNLSTRQFKEPDLVDRVLIALERTGLDPRHLKLEVTESGVMEDPENAVKKMDDLRRCGIRFSIDDFGTGYSSLSYLKRFPIDTLKIDRSFVCEAMTNRDDREIIKTIINMARNLRIETVAEGVETREQQEFLNSQGCRMMQGYYFGRPMPQDQFEKLLDEKGSAPAEDCGEES